jgi:intein/homing endonuclease
VKVVNNTDKSVVVRWKKKTVDQSVEITLIQLFPKGSDRETEVIVEDALDDTVYIQHVEDNNND